MAKFDAAAKQPHIAWRITRVILHILGKIVLWALIIAGTLAVIAVIAGSIFMSKISDYLKSDIIPAAEEYAATLQLDSSDMAQTSIILYTDPQTGEVKELQQLYATENRIWASYDELSPHAVHAAVAIEDKRFYDHDGVDWIRTLSAMGNFVGGDASYGASTITQQLIKNLSEEDEVTISRKVQEIFRALAVEDLYTKNEIMEWYLNSIYLGEGCYGIESAAQVYFAKDSSMELTAAEAASIIAITNNPSLYDPYINPEGNRNRQVIILNEMYAQGYLTENELEEALAQEMVFQNGRYKERTYECLNSECDFEGTSDDYVETADEMLACPLCGRVNHTIDTSSGYSYFVDTVYRDVVSDLAEQLGVSTKIAEQRLLTGGYRIYCTIDPAVQAQVDEVYQNLSNVPKTASAQQLQSAIVVIDNETGDIVAIAGGVGEKNGSLTYNRAEASLPTGSSVKPLSVYGPALDAGVITPATALEDSSFYDEYEDDWPLNESRTYSGMTLVLNGVSKSLNTISVKTLDRLGLQESYDFMTRQLNITSLVEDVEIGGKSYTDIAYAPLGLGEQTYGISVREMTQAYATFPNNGVFREARTYTRVEDANGNIILENLQESHTAIGEKAAYYMNYMLEYAVDYGTGYPARMDNMAVAGKTGTSNNNQSRWFAGYTPYYTAVVWCGYDQQEQIIVSGTNPAVRMWNQVMQPLHEDLEERSFLQPDNVVYCKVCADCGMLATDACKEDMRGSRAVTVKLFSEDVPRRDCQCHVMVTICSETGKVATEYCTETEEIGMLLYNEDWKVNKDKEYVYDPEEAETCDLHAEPPEPTEPLNPTESTEPTEPPTPTEPTEPTEPIESDPAAITEDEWYDFRKIVW